MKWKFPEKMVIKRYKYGLIFFLNPWKSFGLILNSMIVASVVTNLDNAMVEDDEDKENKDEEDFIPVSDTLAEEFDETEKVFFCWKNFILGYKSLNN